MSTPSAAELIFVAIQAAMNAGALLRSGFGTLFQINAKPGNQNLVTEYDLAAEKKIIDFILKHYPDHSILAEESGHSKKSSSNVTWIIDPLDGTVNYAHGVPVFSVSIGVAIDKKIVCGVVYQPMTNELFTALIGKGAYLDGKQLFVSKTDKLENALMCTGFPYNVDTNPLHCVEKFARMQLKGVPLRRLGSAAIDLAYVAAGKCDVFWEVGLQPWDMAAGKILIEEAGGIVTHWDGSDHRIYEYEPILASNGLLHATMIEYLKPEKGIF